MNLLSEEMLKELDISSLSQAEQKLAIDRVGRTIFQAVLVKSLDILSVKEEEELDLLLDKNNTKTEDVLNFLRSKIPTFNKLLKDERQNLKGDLLVNA